jgi:hypothetical protein
MDMASEQCYHAEIDAVDGERVYVIFTPDVMEALAFLAQHDHEGSSVTVYNDEVAYENEDAYSFLEGEL